MQYFFKHVQGVINSIFRLNLFSKFDSLLPNLGVTNADVNGFRQTLDSQFLIPNGFRARSQRGDPLSPKMLIKYKRYNTGWYTRTKTKSSCTRTTMVNCHRHAWKQPIVWGIIDLESIIGQRLISKPAPTHVQNAALSALL